MIGWLFRAGLFLALPLRLKLIMLALGMVMGGTRTRKTVATGMFNSMMLGRRPGQRTQQTSANNGEVFRSVARATGIAMGAVALEGLRSVTRGRSVRGASQSTRGRV